MSGAGIRGGRVLVAGMAVAMLAALSPAALSYPRPGRAERVSVGGEGAEGPAWGGWGRVRSVAFDRLEDTRSLLASGRLADAVLAAAGLVDVSPDELTPASVEAAPVPVGLAAAAARLLEAEARAARLARAALKAEPAELAAIMEQIMSAATRGGAAGVLDSAGLRELGDRATRAVDRLRLYGAALVLARAIDDSLGPLLAHAATLPASDAAVDGCDIADQPPVLCIGGTGSNTYVSDYALLIDLGGDDVHANSAGGAIGLIRPVAVTIDLAGNDRYLCEVCSASAQGSGIYGGIGILLDASGNDTYEATARQGPASQAWGQGLGIQGVGILADLGGDDTYRLSNLSSGRQDSSWGVRADGQATAGGGGMGIVLDAAGDDDYLVETRVQPFVDADGALRMLAPTTFGFGTASTGGAALHADGGGTDSMSLEARGLPVAPGDPRPLEGFPDLSLTAAAWGFGWSLLGGGAAVVSGPGDTIRSAKAVNQAPEAGPGWVWAFGASSIGGYGGLSDAGGNDSYLAESVSHAARTSHTDDACGCAGAQATARAHASVTFGLGYGQFGGVGVLQDVAGDDAYRAIATTIAEADARDDRGGPDPEGGPSARAIATAGSEQEYANIQVQGVGISEGAGFIEDGSGNDLYDARATNLSRATSSALLSPATLEARATLSAWARSWAQAFGVAGGYGELRDLGGRDTYSSTSESSATADPPTAVGQPSAITSVQASVEELGLAHLLDVDGGAADAFFASPPDPACSGTRGQGIWQDCGSGLSLGTNQ